jgi:hypothetical protein
MQHEKGQTYFNKVLDLDSEKQYSMDRKNEFKLIIFE